MKYIDEISPDLLKGKRVLVRAGLDVPLGPDGEVTDVFRIRRACATLQYLSGHGARVIVLSHIGREPSGTNAPVARALSAFVPVSYVPDITGDVAQSVLHTMKDGDIILLENIRQHYDLEKANDAAYAQALAALGDMYVNDAFSNSHRKHASMVGIPPLVPSYGGLLLKEEITALTEALNPPHPALAIIGGAKFETKDPVIRAFLDVYDHVCVVGAIANDVLKAKGLPVGRSRVSEHAPDSSVVSNPRLLSPRDVTVERSDKQARIKKAEQVEADDKIVDIGPDTLSDLAPIIEKARFVTWNGPTGLFEEGYLSWTEAIAELLLASPAKKVIGGGDTIAAIQESGFDVEKLSFLSTGGGAMLEYLLQGTLPAIDALEQSTV